MFCSCGQEIFGDANICPKCGRPQRDTSAPAQAPSPPRDGAALWHLHTYDWSGECPNCQLVHTFETALCPNDKKPLVVAFNVGRLNPFAFIRLPMQTAHLRCSGGCGFQADSTRCTQCGKVITGKSIRFGMPKLSNMLYQLSYVVVFAYAFMLTVYPFALGVREALRSDHAGPVLFVLVALFIIPLLITYELWKVWWWKFQSRLDFERKNRR